MPSCEPAWWDEEALRNAVAVELRAFGIAPVTDEHALGHELSLRLELEVVLAGECRESSTLILRVRDREGIAERTIELADVLPSTRARAIAMALAALIEAPRTRATAPVSDPDPDLASGLDSASASASASASDSASASASDSASASASASAPAPAPAPAPAFALELSGTLLLAPASLTPWGGARSALLLRIAPPFILHAAFDALFTNQSDPLGQVRGTWIAGSFGAGIEAEFSPIRIGGRASLGVGWTQLEGIAASTSAIARTSDDTVITIDLALRGVIDIVREFAIVLELEGRIVTLGLDARSPSGSVVAVRDGVLGIRLGAEFRP